MENWQPGDIAICINNGMLPHSSEKGELPPLRINTQYVVNKVRTCECNRITLDVGLSNNNNKGIRCRCGAISAPTGIHWAAAERFVKPKTDEAKAENYEEQLELAVQLGDQEAIDNLLDKLNK